MLGFLFSCYLNPGDLAGLFMIKIISQQILFYIHLVNVFISIAVFHISYTLPTPVHI